LQRQEFPRHRLVGPPLVEHWDPSCVVLLSLYPLLASGQALALKPRQSCDYPALRSRLSNPPETGTRGQHTITPCGLLQQARVCGWLFAHATLCAPLLLAAATR